MVGSSSIRSAPTIWISSSAVVVTTTYTIYKLLQWRARQRARKIVRQVCDYMKEDGPLIDYMDPVVRDRILRIAYKRASKWMELSPKQIQPMVGQVGGIASHKKPLLTLSPDYVLKPIINDHRGIREIAFYEAIRILSQTTKHIQRTYSSFLTGRDNNGDVSANNNNVAAGGIIKSKMLYIRERLDTIAMALAIFCHDRVVLDAEVAVRDAWRGLKREVDILRQLQKFAPIYYGVIDLSSYVNNSAEDNKISSETKSRTSNDNNTVQTVPLDQAPNTNLDSRIPPSPFGISDDAHLLLQDLTINYSKPCVMDLKMGVQSYEPDATPTKRAREYGKYPQQTQFGFRIVGMRFYDPHHIDADEKGFRYYQKPFGRSLTTRQQLLDAFRIFFSAGTTGQQQQPIPSSSSMKLQSGEQSNDTIPPLIGSPHESDKGTTNGVHHSNLDLHQSQPQQLPIAVDGTSSSTTAALDSTSTAKPFIRARTVSNLLVQLRPLRRWFEENKSLRFYASSLLIVYEGDVNANNADLVTIKMIDFGRVRREAGGDQGYSTGLNTLKDLWVELWDEHNAQDEERRRIRPHGEAHERQHLDMNGTKI